MKRPEAPNQGAGVGVNGRLLRWARQEQQLTMRHVREHGGPCPGFQCEVEHGAKTEVRSDLLATWARALHVTESFARGAIPVYSLKPLECRGLAGWVAAEVRRTENWMDMGPAERARRVLWLIPQEGGRLPKIVLAYTLGITLKTLQAMLVGEHPIMPMQMQAIADLTALPIQFFKHGVLDEPDQLGGYLSVVRLAQARDVSPEQLDTLLRSWLELPQANGHGTLGSPPRGLAGQ